MKIAAAIVLLIGAGLLSFEAVAAAMDNRRLKAPGRLVDIGTHSLHIACQGEGGPTVLLEGGAGEFSAYWTKVQPSVARFTRVCAYDRAGLGWSQRGPSPRTIPRLANELHTLLIKADLEPPYVLVPHSLGGAIAMHFASEHPDDVAGIVFVDAAYRELYEEYERSFPQWLGRIRRAKLFLRAGSIASYFGIPRLIRFKLSSAELPAESRDAANSLGRRPKAIDAVRTEAEGLFESRDAKSEPHSRIPVVVLTHTKEGMFNDPQAEELWLKLQQQLAQRFEEADFRKVADSGHFIQLEQPVSVVEAIRDVLERTRRTKTTRGQ